MKDKRLAIYKYCHLIILPFLFACENKLPQEINFKAWFSKNYSSSKITHIQSISQKVIIESRELKIDTIYRSMQGPYDVKTVSFNEERNELLWLTGYSSEIINAEDEQILSDDFMCHNNLEITDKNSFPWKLKTIGTNIRLFTLTEGQTKVQMPVGYGIPFPASEKASLFSQVLNHNVKNPHMIVKHRVNIEYTRQSDHTTPLVPLYQQAVFITKQISGPPGNYGEVSTNTESLKDANIRYKSCDTNCEIRLEKNAFNPYADNFGRTYSGHWEIPLGKEILKTDVTEMLNLWHDTRVHFIGVHVHPFAVSLELRDITADTSVFKAYVKNFSNKIGIEKIDNYSSEVGIALFKSHRYELISEYNCNDSTANHTAMATMFLYLEEK